MKSLKIVQGIIKVLSIFVQIGFVFTIVGALLSLIGGISLLCSSYLSENIVKFIMSEVRVDSMTELGVALVSECVYLTSVAIAMGFICRYFKNELNDGTPFTHRGAKELLKTGIIYLAVPLGGLCLSAIIMSIAGVSENLISNESEIASGVAMILISFVFRYGADLINNNAE